MTLSMQAAVVREVNALTIERVLLDEPHPREVLVRMQAAGVCHSDLGTLQGRMRAAPPLVLGHEGAGIVEAIGSEVTRVKPGDHVLINWMPHCNVCPQCLRGRPHLCERLYATTFQAYLPDGTTRLRTEDGLALKHYLSASTMAEWSVLDESSVVPIPEDVPFDVAAVIGCAVVTGVGAALHTGNAKPGMTAAVIGCGGVGLSAIMGCALASCQTIIAVDTVPGKLEFARELGATHTLLATSGMDLPAAFRQIVRGGPDLVIDSVGATATVAQALDGVMTGGTAVVVGLYEVHTPAPINLVSLVYGNKRLAGSFFGESKPLVDLPMLVAHYRAGRLPVQKLISTHYALEELPRAFADMEAGAVARGVLTIGSTR